MTRRSMVQPAPASKRPTRYGAPRYGPRSYGPRTYHLASEDERSTT